MRKINKCYVWGNVINQTDKSWKVKIKSKKPYFKRAVYLSNTYCSIVETHISLYTGFMKQRFEVPDWLWERIENDAIDKYNEKLKKWEIKQQ